MPSHLETAIFTNPILTGLAVLAVGYFVYLVTKEAGTMPMKDRLYGLAWAVPVAFLFTRITMWMVHTGQLK